MTEPNNVIDLFGDPPDEEDPPEPAEKPSERRAARETNVTTVAEELIPEQIPGTAGRNPPAVVQLLAVWDQQGRPSVAKAVNGSPVEAWRAPTPQEWELLRQGGRMVRGGLSAAPEVSAVPGGTAMKKLLIAGAALAAVGGLAYWYVKKREDSMEEDVDELD